MQDWYFFSSESEEESCCLYLAGFAYYGAHEMQKECYQKKLSKIFQEPCLKLSLVLWISLHVLPTFNFYCQLNSMPWP